MAENFTPGETVTLTAQSTSASAAFTLAQSAGYPDCMIANAGAQTAFIAFGIGIATQASTPAAGALNCIPVLPGETLILRKGIGITTCAAVTASGTTTVYFTAGQGS